MGDEILPARIATSGTSVDTSVVDAGAIAHVGSSTQASPSSLVALHAVPNSELDARNEVRAKIIPLIQVFLEGLLEKNGTKVSFRQTEDEHAQAYLIFNNGLFPFFKDKRSMILSAVTKLNRILNSNDRRWGLVYTTTDNDGNLLIKFNVSEKPERVPGEGILSSVFLSWSYQQGMLEKKIGYIRDKEHLCSLLSSYGFLKQFHEDTGSKFQFDLEGALARVTTRDPGKLQSALNEANERFNCENRIGVFREKYVTRIKDGEYLYEIKFYPTVSNPSYIRYCSNLLENREMIEELLYNSRPILAPELEYELLLNTGCLLS